jgi:WD40 repeat protein
MTAEELRRAIEEPAQLAGYDFEPGLVDLLLHDMTDEPGALPLLSHALLETWQRCRKRTLTLEDYHESGGVGGAIAKTAETVYNQLTPEQKAIARRIFLAVTELGEGTQDTRRRAMLTELIPRLEEKPTVEALLKTLADSRLITTSEDTVEVAHEALIRKWPALRQWLDENREGLRIHRRLLEFAQEWNKNGHDSDYLYRGLRLDQAQAWAKTHVDEMGELEHDFLKASLAERKRLADEQAEQERRQAQIVRQRRIAIGLSFGLLVLAVLAIFAFEQRSQAIEQSNVAATARGQAELDRDLAVQSQQAAIVAQAEAEAENRVSSSRGLAADALINLPIDPELSILLAIEALAITHTTQAENALHRALQTSRIERTINDHTHWVYDIAFSPDGNYLATASFDGTAKVWDLASSQVLEALSGYEEIGLTSVAFNPGGTLLAVADGEGNVHLWDVTNRTQAFSQPLSIHSWIFDLTFSPDGTLLAIASTDGTTESGTATIWNIETGQIVYTLPHDAWICGIGFSPGGTRLITGSYDGTVKIWDTASGRLVKSLIHDIGGEVCGVAFSPVDGTLLVTAGQDQKVKIWNINADQPLLILSEHTNTVWRVAFSPDGERLATGSFDGTAKVWDATSGRLLSTLSGHRDRLRGIAFSSDGQHLATASEDGIVKIWNVGISQHEDEIRRVVFSPDGMRVATASLDKTASIWDVASGQRLRHLKGHQGPIQDVAFNPDGQRLATASDDGSVRLWDAETGRLLYKLSSDETPVLAVAFSPDKTFLAAAGMNEVTLWNVDTGQKLNTLAEHEGRIFSLAFHPDGQLLATAGEDQTVKLWNISTSELLHTLWHERSEIYRVAFSADGEKLATAGEDKTVKVWDVATGQKLFEISAQAERVLDVAFSKDGAYLVTASSDGTAKVWDISQVNNGQTLDTERLNLDHTRAVNSLAISPDGRRLATGGADQILRFYLINLDDLLKFAQTRVTRTLSPGECQRYLGKPSC